LHECFDNVALGTHATDVVVTVGSTVADVAIEFGDGADLATLAGVLTVADGTPASGVNVEIIAAPNVDFFVAPPPQKTATDEAGVFRADVPYGNYLIRFSDPRGLYFGSDYRETAEVITPTVVTLDRSDELTITAVLSAAAQITGNVTIDGAIAGMSGQVSAYTMTEQGWAPGGTGNIVAATGVYTVAGLRGGSYRLQVSIGGLPAQIIYGGTTLETAAEVEVMTATVTGGIDFDLTPYLALVPYGTISGTVLASGAPQPDMRVQVYEAGFDCCNAPAPMLATTTDAEGRFSAGGLPPGSYKIGIRASDQPYSSFYAPDQRTFETAAVFVIGNPADGVARQVISDVNIVLGPTGSVARRVLRPDDTPVVGATVNLYQRLGEPGSFPLVASTLTNEEGRYGFAGLVPDIYQLCIVATGIAEPSCAGRGGLGMGFDVAVSEGQETTGIDILDVP
jgi:5-hydroxyisourate hydrolase-like protein (transthyretin family)